MPRLVVSLWPVPDDPTKKLMTRFYQRLTSQPDEARAMADAMRLAIDDNDPPAAWAAFLVIGAPEPAAPKVGS